MTRAGVNVLALALVLGCGSPRRPAEEPLENRTAHEPVTDAAIEPPAQLACDREIPADTGAVHGIVRDEKTSQVVAGVAVFATHRWLSHQVSVVTDEAGCFFIGNLPAGEYLVAMFYNEHTADQTVRVVVGQAILASGQIATAP